VQIHHDAFRTKERRCARHCNRLKAPAERARPHVLNKLLLELLLTNV
jgi:hypothetical protein